MESSHPVEQDPVGISPEAPASAAVAQTSQELAQQYQIVFAEGGEVLPPFQDLD